MLCDFGQARQVGTEPLTPGRQAVVYRCPEMILGEEHAQYSYPIDMWSAGVIFTEMLTGQHCFREACEIGVLHAIFRDDGNPV
jgi:serine/threonine protein kinase